jgi:manganese-dependent inorganic pyrophosphatase
MRPVPLIHVTGHRNPDTDSIASAIGYAELRGRQDPDNTYIPVRLGDINSQTRWVLEQAGAAQPMFLPHIMLRVRDVMQHDFYAAGVDDAVREVGLTMAQDKLDVVPIVDHDGRTTRSSRGGCGSSRWRPTSPRPGSPPATS